MNFALDVYEEAEDLKTGSTITPPHFHLAVGQGACILTGIGFNGYSTASPVSDAPKALWDRVENIDIWKIETAQSFKVLFDSWNCRANVSGNWVDPEASFWSRK